MQKETKNYQDKERNMSGIKKHTDNRIDNAILLCSNHHKEADHKLLDKNVLQKIINDKLKRKSDTLSN